MKSKYKYLALIAVILFALPAKAQINFGVTGGVLNVNPDLEVSALGFDIADLDIDGSTGFYIGLLAEFEISDRFHFQPELTYGNADDISNFYLPLTMKIYIIQGLNFQVAPQFTFSNKIGSIEDALDDLDDLIGVGLDADDLVKSFSFDLGLGLGYDITDRFVVQARYAIPLSDVYDGPLKGTIDLKVAAFQFGLAYFFN